MTSLRYMSAILFGLLLFMAAVLAAQPLHIPLETPVQDKSFSEFNHHVAGYFLLILGISAFLGNAVPQLAFLRRVWPILFVVPGLYLAVMSDPDVWPMGDQNWLQAFQNNAEAAQHKTFAALLVALGILEFQRSLGRISGFISVWTFPFLALFGAVLLFFHPHGSQHMTHAMSGMDHGGMVMTESMLKIKQEHLWFSIVGFCIVLFKFLSDAQYGKKLFFSLLWPACISLLGVLLILYRE